MPKVAGHMARRDVPGDSQQARQSEIGDVDTERTPFVVASGWYGEPGDPTRERYWDGRQWTPQTQPTATVHLAPRLPDGSPVPDLSKYPPPNSVARDKHPLRIGLIIGAVVVLGAVAAGATALLMDHKNHVSAADMRTASSDSRIAVSVIESCYTTNSAYPDAVSSDGIPTGLSCDPIPLSPGSKIAYAASPGSTPGNYIFTITAGRATLCYASADVGGHIVSVSRPVTEYRTSC